MLLALRVLSAALDFSAQPDPVISVSKSLGIRQSSSVSRHTVFTSYRGGKPATANWPQPLSLEGKRGSSKLTMRRVPAVYLTCVNSMFL